MRECWQDLVAFSGDFTCYSAAVATWVAWADPGWQRTVNPGLRLTITEPGHGLFGFAHFPPGLRAQLGLERSGSDDADEAIDGVRAEMARSGRVVITGDGFNLPWHVAHQRAHVPHWYVLTGPAEAPLMVDPFACRNELGVQLATCEPVDVGSLERLLLALPDESPVYRLREELALGDDAGPRDRRRYQWFVHGEIESCRTPSGTEGPAAVLRLASHFRARGQELEAYVQADDIWSIGRHRAFLSRRASAVSQQAGDANLATWVQEHAAPLAKRWGHIAPLVMQATYALRAGRAASASVAEVLEELAGREQAAAEAFPGEHGADSI